MSFDPHARRFDRHWRFPAIETDGAETSNTPYVSPFSPDEELTNDVDERDIDEALEQIASEKRYLCPLCGAAVASDGTSRN
jgi:hypothetical protein